MAAGRAHDMKLGSPGRRGARALAYLALLAAAAAPATLLQGPDATSAAHYALIRSLSLGTPAIDETVAGVMEGEQTNDVLFLDGHVYSNKAPGLAFVSLPAYLALDALGLRTSGEATRPIWALGLWGVVLPLLAAMALVRLLAERIAPGYGTAAATVLGVGTLLLPFGSLYFSHALSAFLCVAAFTLLWLERERPPALPLVGAAGLVAGYAVTTEYPNVIAVAALGAYAVARGDVARRGAVYALGALAGVAPLLAYQWWAFGSVARVPYAGTESGPPLEDAFHAPSLSALAALLFSLRGLVVLTPVLAAGLAGIVQLYRRGRRAEALTIAAMAAGYLLFVSSFFDPFGAVSLPRYLITIFPFLAVPLALALRALPATAWTLAAGSALVMVAITATRPLGWFDGGLVERFTSGAFEPLTVLSLVGLAGRYEMAPFFLLAAGALACALLATPARITRADARTALVAVAGWLLVARVGNDLLLTAGFGAITGALLAFALVAAIALAVGAVHLDGWRGLAGLPFLAAAAIPGVPGSVVASLVAVALAATLLAERRRVVGLLTRRRASERSRPLPS